MELTGHPFIDAGMAGAAALIERYTNRKISSLSELSEADIIEAISLAEEYWFQQPFRKDVKQKDKPLFCFLLQEILPGSSWDQVKKPELSHEIPVKLKSHIQGIQDAIKRPPLGTCFLTGKLAHVVASKTFVPMLSSAAERPNCYPNLQDGLLLNGYLALAVLLSPFSAEKSVKADGKSGLSLLYQSIDWQFSVAIAQQKIARIEAVLAANAFEIYAKSQKGTDQTGLWRAALRTLIAASDQVPHNSYASTVIWCFKASNQDSNYECLSASVSLIKLLQERRRNPWIISEMMRGSDGVCRSILQGEPIVRRSIFFKEVPPENHKKGKRIKKEDYLKVQVAHPAWNFQRLYAEEVLNMSSSFLDAVEEAATYLASDKVAVNFCLREMKRPQITILAARYGLPSQVVLRLSQEPSQWLDYLRAALLWVQQQPFASRQKSPHTPGDLENLIVDAGPRIAKFKSYAAAARLLNKPVGAKYRQAWVHLLYRHAGTWDDFLAFNPIEEAMGTGVYSHTRLRRDYLLAYLWSCSHETLSAIEQEDEDELDVEEEEFEVSLVESEWEEEMEEIN